MDLTNIIINENTTILEAMEQINKNGYGISVICNNNKLKAVVTDGDIRRHILKNGNLQDSVKSIANYSPLYVLKNNKHNYTNFMRKQHITAMPIVDEQMNVISIESIYQDNMINKKNKKLKDTSVVIMAGGKGTRLSPYTDILPKPLIPIGDKTITEHILERFENYGCTHFDIIVNYKKNLIRSYFLDNERKHNIDFIEESSFLGTGGGLKLLEGRYKNSFFMSNCDILIDENYSAMMDYHNTEGNILTMISAMKNITIPYGTIHIEDNGQVKQLKEKPNLSFMTNTGLYIIHPKFLEQIPANSFIHITDVIQQCIDSGEKIGVYPISEYSWMDMGQISELEKMKNRIEN